MEVLFLSQLKKAIKKLLRYPNSKGYTFYPSKSIEKQSIIFKFKENLITLEADYTTPLYETIAEIVDYDCYQLEKIDLRNSESSIILDIGANIGTFSIMIAKVYKGKILSFEPIQKNCQIFTFNLKLNGISNVSIMPFAVSAFDGKLYLNMDSEQSVSAHLPMSNEKDKRLLSIEVNSLSLPTIMKQYPNKEVDLIKIDCEGGEYDIIDQLTDDLSKRIRYITLEVHDRSRECNLKTIKHKLEKLGFKTFYKPEMFNRYNLHHLLASRD